MHTLILNMCVLVPFGVNNPASLLTFYCNRSHATKSEYEQMICRLQSD